MDDILQFACENAHSAKWVFMSLILLAGLNVPISIDIVLITAGAFAATCLEDPTHTLLLLLFLSCWISAWEAYWIGRLLGPKLYDIRWFRHILTLRKVERLHHYYEKFGWLTFMVGRFIPGGVRNALFLTSGLGRMPFHKFILRDLPACLASCASLYSLGYVFGQNYKTIVEYFKAYQFAAVIVILLLLTSIFFFRFRKIRSSREIAEEENREL